MIWDSGCMYEERHEALLHRDKRDIYIHTYIHTYMHAYIHTYIHIYICICICTSSYIEQNKGDSVCRQGMILLTMRETEDFI